MTSRFDWFARQVGLAADGNRLIVSNRFQVDCYEMPVGQAAVAYRPVARCRVAGNGRPGRLRIRPDADASGDCWPALVVRRLMRGPASAAEAIPAVATLACLDKASGKVQWSTANHLAGQLHYISDPMVIQDQVFAVGQKQSPVANGR